MDAKITKQRLGNMLSYDWLKILIAIVAAIVGLSLLFTMVKTKPRTDQKFYVYNHSAVFSGSDFNSLSSDLSEAKIFSYDILSVGQEKFSSDSTGSQVFSARRSAGEGAVMFVSDYRIYETDANGNVVKDEQGNDKIKTESSLYSLGVGYGAKNTTDGSTILGGAMYDVNYLITSCEGYLKKFYGEEWKTNDALDMEKVKNTFLKRNKNDKRYRKQAAKEQGILDEATRIQSLKEDFLFVLNALEEGTITLTEKEYTYTENNITSVYRSASAINVSKLKGIGKLAYYTDSDGKTNVTDTLNLILFNNAGFAKTMDLQYESFSFVRYLIENYAENK